MERNSIPLEAPMPPAPYVKSILKTLAFPVRAGTRTAEDILSFPTDRQRRRQAALRKQAVFAICARMQAESPQVSEEARRLWPELEKVFSTSNDTDPFDLKSNPVTAAETLTKCVGTMSTLWGMGSATSEAEKCALQVAIATHTNQRTEVTAECYQQGHAMYARYPHFFNALYQAQYAICQKDMDTAGATTIKAWRMTGKGSALRPLSSFSLSHTVVREFWQRNGQHSDRDIIEWDIPKERIWSTCANGFGEHYQLEILPIGYGAADEAHITRLTPREFLARYNYNVP